MVSTTENLGYKQRGESPQVVPLCVDLDGTLLRSDSLQELLLSLLRQRPWKLASCILLLFRGKSVFKAQLSEWTSADYRLWPYEEIVLKQINFAKAAGRPIYLVTAASSQVAEGVSTALGVFDGLFASTAEKNLRGLEKAKLLETKFGVNGFDYIGNEWIDLHVWSKSRTAFVMGSASFARSVERQIPHIKVERLKSKSKTPNALTVMAKTLRIHQWLKNILILVPIVAAHRLTDFQAIIASLLGFTCFSALASAVYILNDLFDIDSDRTHFSKKHRPFASGDLSIAWGIVGLPLLIISGLMFATKLPSEFQIYVVAYLATTTLYTFWFKKLAVLDVVVLTLLYTLRILAGGAATGIVISEWLITFSMFLFLSLALLKRYSELNHMAHNQIHKSPGRGYEMGDLPLVQVFGATSGYLAVLVFAFYIHNESVRSLYRHPEILWLACPVLLYWITRIWLTAHRGLIDADALVFAFKQKYTYVVGFLLSIILIYAVQ